MKRDMDLVRAIALATENLKTGETLDGLPDVEDEAFAQHAQWMLQAGLVQALVTEFVDGHLAANVLRLTWAGCDFAESTRDEGLWAKAKSSILTPAGSWTFDLLKEWLKAEIKNGLPTLRGLAQ